MAWVCEDLQRDGENDARATVRGIEVWLLLCVSTGCVSDNTCQAEVKSYTSVVEEQGTSQLVANICESARRSAFVRGQYVGCRERGRAALGNARAVSNSARLCTSRHLSALYSPRLNSPPRVAAPAMMGNACAGGGAVLLYRVWLNIVGESPPAGSMRTRHQPCPDQGLNELSKMSGTQHTPPAVGQVKYFGVCEILIIV
jgi:hypothetical protein